MMTKLAEKIKSMPQVDYHFAEAEHLHLLDGKPLTGVTTVLSVIAKPALIQWAADETAKYLGWYNEKYQDEQSLKLCQTLAKAQHDLLKTMDLETYIKFLSEARVQHAKRKKDAGTIGTDTHAEIERLVKDAIVDNDGYISFTLEGGNALVQNFLNWAIENKVKFLESEKHVYSRKMWIGGITDLVFEMDGKRFVGDVKTGNAIYNEHFYQMAAYEMCLEEMGYEKVDGYLVINLKKDGTMDLKMAENREINKQAFLHALGLYQISNSLE